MRAQLLCLATVLVSFASWGADAFEGSRYFDETTMRHLTLEKTGFGTTRVIMRSAAAPGASGLWAGMGQRKDKQLVFAQEVGEGENRGTFYVANVSESKLEVTLKPGQQKAPDAGLVGIYHRVSDSKLQQLAKKESQAATARLAASLQAASKSWKARDRPALAIWKEQWPATRQRWIAMTAAPAKTPKTATLTAAPAAAPADKSAADWFKLAEVTYLGYVFVETLPDAKVGTGWNGEYDDFAGGHASLSLQKDGRLRVNLSFSRAGDAQTGNLDGIATPEQLSEGKNGELIADFTCADPEVKDAAQQAKIHLVRLGHYLQIETKQAQRYAAHSWFDGIYRGAPPAVP